MENSDLTPRQRAVIEAVIKHGGQKRASRELGITIETIGTHMEAIRWKMEAPTTLAACIAYDRKAREVLVRG